MAIGVLQTFSPRNLDSMIKTIESTIESNIESTIEKKSPQKVPTFFHEALGGNHYVYNAAAPLGAARKF